MASTSQSIASSSSAPPIPVSNACDSIRKGFNLPDSTEKTCFDFVWEECKKRNWTQLVPFKDDIAKIRDENGRSVLQRAIDVNEIVLANDIIAQGIAIHTTDLHRNTALHYAARIGDAKLLINLWQQINQNEPNITQQTPLHVAALEGQRNSASPLISFGALLNTQATYSEGDLVISNLTPLAFAVINGHKTCVDLFLDQKKNGKTVTTDFPPFGTLLHLAIAFHQMELLEHLLTKHSSTIIPLLETPNAEGLTPFMFSAQIGANEALTLLKKHGANIEAKDRQEKRAIHYAALSLNRDTILHLAFLGCKLKPVDKTDNHQMPHYYISHLQDPESKSTKYLLINLIDWKEVRKKQPPNFIHFPPENLVFEGGDSNHAAQLGALSLLEERSMIDTVKRVAGSSTGALLAVLTALGYRSFEILGLLGENRIEKFFEGKEKNVQGTIHAIKVILSNPSPLVADELQKLWNMEPLYDNKALLEFIERCINEKTKIPDCTFRELNLNKAFKHLHLFALKIETHPSIVRFNSEKNEWADAVISDVVAACMAFPGITGPQHIRFKYHPTAAEIKEFGLYGNAQLYHPFPLEAFDRRRYQTTTSLGSTAKDNFQLNRRTLGLAIGRSQKTVNAAGSRENIACQLIRRFYQCPPPPLPVNNYNNHRIIILDSSESFEKGATAAARFFPRDDDYDSLLLKNFLPKKPSLSSSEVSVDTNGTRVSTPASQTDDPILKRILGLISNGKHADTHSQPLLLIYSLETKNLAPLYHALIESIPHFTSEQFDLLFFQNPDSALKRLLDTSPNFQLEQIDLAVRLANRYAKKMDTPTFPIAAAIQAIAYYGYAINITEKHLPNYLKQLDHHASEIIKKIVYDLYFQSDELFNRLKEAVEEGEIETFASVLDHMQQLKKYFPSDQELESAYIPIYDKASTLIYSHGNETFRTRFSDRLLQDQRHLIATPTRITEHYRSAFAKVKKKNDEASLQFFFSDFLFPDALAILGPPPCDFDFCAIGKIGPNKPISWILLIEDSTHYGYFKKLLELIEVQLASLGGSTFEGVPSFSAVERNCRFNLTLFPRIFMDDYECDPRIGSPKLLAEYTLNQLSGCPSSNFPEIKLHEKIISLKRSSENLLVSYRSSLTQNLNAQSSQPAPNHNTLSQEIGFHLLKSVQATTDAQDTFFLLLDSLTFFHNLFALNNKGGQHHDFLPFCNKSRKEILKSIGKTCFTQETEQFFTRKGFRQLPLTFQTLHTHINNYFQLTEVRNNLSTTVKVSKSFDPPFKRFSLIDFAMHHYIYDPTSFPPLMEELLEYLLVNGSFHRITQWYRKLSQNNASENIREHFIAYLERKENTRGLAARLMEIPNSAGVRVSYEREKRAFEDNLKAITQSTRPESTVVCRIISPTLRETHYLKEEIVSKIIDPETGLLIENSETLHFCFERNPADPLMDFAIHEFIARIMGKGSAINELSRFKITIDGETFQYPVLISENIAGNTLQEHSEAIESALLPQKMYELITFFEEEKNRDHPDYWNFVNTIRFLTETATIFGHNFHGNFTSEASFETPPKSFFDYKHNTWLSLCNLLVQQIHPTPPDCIMTKEGKCLFRNRRQNKQKTWYPQPLPTPFNLDSLSFNLNKEALSSFTSLNIKNIVSDWLETVHEMKSLYQEQQRKSFSLPNYSSIIEKIYSQFDLLSFLTYHDASFFFSSEQLPQYMLSFLKKNHHTNQRHQRTSWKSDLSHRQPRSELFFSLPFMPINYLQSNYRINPSGFPKINIDTFLDLNNHFFAKYLLGILEIDFRKWKGSIDFQERILLFTLALCQQEMPKIIILRYCEALTDEYLSKFLHENLHTLDVRGSSKLTNVDAVEKKSPNLAELNMSECPGLTFFSTGTFFSYRVKLLFLKKIDVSHCNLKSLHLESCELETLDVSNNGDLGTVDLLTSTSPQIIGKEFPKIPISISRGNEFLLSLTISNKDFEEQNFRRALQDLSSNSKLQTLTLLLDHENTERAHAILQEDLAQARAKKNLNLHFNLMGIEISKLLFHRTKSFSGSRGSENRPESDLILSADDYRSLLNLEDEIRAIREKLRKNRTVIERHAEYKEIVETTSSTIISLFFDISKKQKEFFDLLAGYETFRKKDGKYIISTRRSFQYPPGIATTTRNAIMNLVDQMYSLLGHLNQIPFPRLELLTSIASNSYIPEKQFPENVSQIGHDPWHVLQPTFQLLSCSRLEGILTNEDYLGGDAKDQTFFDCYTQLISTNESSRRSSFKNSLGDFYYQVILKTLNLSQNGTYTCAETLKRITEHYDLQGFDSHFILRREITLDTSRSDYASPRKIVTEKPCRRFIFELPVIEAAHMQELIDSLFAPRLIEKTLTFSHQKETYTVNQFQEQLVPSELNQDLFFQFSRDVAILLPDDLSSIEIEGTVFELTTFITQYERGYMTGSKREGAWYLFKESETIYCGQNFSHERHERSSSPPNLPSQVLEQARRACFMHYTSNKASTALPLFRSAKPKVELPEEQKPTSVKKEKYVETPPTKADGACALHALNANTTINGERAFVLNESEGEQIGRAAKQDFLQKMHENMTTFKELYVNCIQEFISHKPELNKIYEQAIHGMSEHHKNMRHSLFRAILDDPLIYSSIFYQEQLDPLSRDIFHNDYEICDNKFTPIWSNILETVGHQEPFQQILNSIAEAERNREAIKESFCTSVQIFNEYAQEVVEPGYYLTDIELKLAAHLYNKKVILRSENHRKEIFNEEASETVVIRHQGVHYTRLEKKQIKLTADN